MKSTFFVFLFTCLLSAQSHLLIKYSEKNVSDLFENCRSLLDERRNVFKSATSVENFCFYIALPGWNDLLMFIFCEKTKQNKQKQEHENIKIRTELFRYWATRLVKSEILGNNFNSNKVNLQKFPDFPVMSQYFMVATLWYIHFYIPTQVILQCNLLTCQSCESQSLTSFWSVPLRLYWPNIAKWVTSHHVNPRGSLQCTGRPLNCSAAGFPETRGLNNKFM